MSKKKMTISDVANIVGVSKTTISRFLNGKFEYMSKETKERIQSVIDISGYQPSNIAQSLKRHTSLLIGVIIADIESPFSSALIKSIGDALQDTKYNLIIANSDNCYETEKKNILSLIAQQVDGLIVNTTRMNNPFLINLVNQGFPIVLVDRIINNYNFNIAFIDNKEPINRAINHLLSEGYDHICFFTEEFEEVSPRYYRRTFFLEKMNELGVKDANKRVFVNDHSKHESIVEQIKLLVDNSKKEKFKPAIICSNGVMLLHIAKAIDALKLRMAEDIGLCGYDDWGWFSRIGWAEMISGGLTTISPSVHQLGKETIDIFLDLLDEKIDTPKQVIVEAPLIVRNSTLLSKYKK